MSLISTAPRPIEDEQTSKRRIVLADGTVYIHEVGPLSWIDIRLAEERRRLVPPPDPPTRLRRDR